MREFGGEAEVADLCRNRVLCYPDTVGKQRIPAGVHDGVQRSIAGLGERVLTVLDGRLQGVLNGNEGLGEVCDLRGGVLKAIHGDSLEREKP